MKQTLESGLLDVPAILEASGEAIATFDGAGMLHAGNRRFCGLVSLGGEELRRVNVSALFPDISFIDNARGRPDVFEAAMLRKPDGARSWVLIKIISLGVGDEGYFTLLIQEPESMRRMLDRLDYIESYDVATGLFNRRKGMLEFGQLQASNLAGGCFLARFEDAGQGSGVDHLVAAVGAVRRHFAGIGSQQILCRYASTELLFIFVTEQPLGHEQCMAAHRLLADDPELGTMHVQLAYHAWSGTDLSSEALIDQLRTRLVALDQPRLFEAYHFGAVEQPVSVLSRLAAALEAGQLVCYIQPQIRTETRQATGGELLIRWVQEDGTVVPPSRFVDHLEDGPLAARFLDWSIGEAAAIVRRLKDATGDWICLSLNIAPSQFAGGELVDQLNAACARHEVPPDFIEVEITERVLAVDTEAVRSVLKALRGCGFRIAIDDFGTGYSSLSYLRQFPLDRLKIDRVFVANLVENEEDRLIAGAIASLAHVLGLEVVVEGVEHPAQASFLQQIGCEYFQGYLTGKPMPVDSFLAFYHEHVADNTELERLLDTRLDALHDGSDLNVVWKKSFTTDVVSVDNEHRNLIDALNQFSEAGRRHPESIDYLATLDMIGAEAVRHFEHEEQVMLNIGYPRYEMHREKHQALIADLSKRRAEVATGVGRMDFEETLKYLKYWLLRHLVSEDTHLHRFINRSASERRIT